MGLTFRRASGLQEMKTLFFFKLISKLIFLMHFLAVGPSCAMWDLLLWPLSSLLPQEGFSLVVAHGLHSMWAQ